MENKIKKMIMQVLLMLVIVTGLGITRPGIEAKAATDYGKKLYGSYTVEYDQDSDTVIFSINMSICTKAVTSYLWTYKHNSTSTNSYGYLFYSSQGSSITSNLGTLKISSGPTRKTSGAIAYYYTVLTITLTSDQYITNYEAGCMDCLYLYVSKSSSSTVSSVTFTNKSDYTFDEIYEMINSKYYVKYNGNESTSGTSYTQEVQYGSSFTLYKNSSYMKFAKTGYTFSGWAISTSGSKKYSDGATITSNLTTRGSTYNLYAYWVANTYTVKFHSNYGSDTTSTQSFTYGTSQNLAASSSVTTRTGYTFSKWNTNSSGTGSNSYSKTQSVKNLTSTSGGTVNLYAQWTVNKYSIKFNANGGSGSMSSMTNISYTSTVTLTANTFTRTGYTFSGWSTTSSGSVEYDDEASVSGLVSTSGGSITLYAVWTINTYYVAFNSNGGSGSMSKMTMVYGKSYNLDPNEFTRTGYYFNKWNTSSDGTGTLSYSDEASVNNLTSTNGATVTLYAQWKANSYSIIYNSNNGASKTVTQSATYDTEVTIKTNTFSYTGYSFAYWNTKEDGSGTDYYAGDSVFNLTSDKGGSYNLYAIWEPVTYTITYNNAGDDYTGPTEYTIETEDFTLPDPSSRADYLFAGWTGTGLSGKTTTVTVSQGSYGARTYTANWTAVAPEIEQDPEDAACIEYNGQTYEEYIADHADDSEDYLQFPYAKMEFSIEASGGTGNGTTNEYTWQISEDKETWENIEDTDWECTIEDNVLTFTNVSRDLNGMYVRCSVTNLTGVAVVSEAAQATVYYLINS